jgi:hypothetical protein
MVPPMILDNGDLMILRCLYYTRHGYKLSLPTYNQYFTIAGLDTCAARSAVLPNPACFTEDLYWSDKG